MNKRIIRFSLLITLFIGCDTKKVKETIDSSSMVSTIKPLSVYKENLIVSDFLSNVQYVIPQINKIIKIDDVIIGDDFIYLIDKSSNHEIYCINHEGKHIYTISNYGGADDEYFNISKVILQNSVLEVFDVPSQKKLVFDSNDGRFMKTKKLNYENDIADIEKLKEGYLIYHSNTCFDQSKCFNYHKVDDNFNILERYLELSENLRNYTLNISSNMHKHNKSIYFKELFNNTIYKLDDSGDVGSFITIDFQDRTLPQDIKYDSRNNDIGPFITKYTFNGDYIFGLRDFVINDNTLFFEYFDKNHINEAYYNLKSKKLVSYRFLDIKDNQKLINKPMYSYKDYFVSVIDVEQILAYKEDAKYRDFTELILSEDPDYDMRSNSVLVFYKVNLD